MVVNFWASTCIPCVTEMPFLEQASKDNPDVTFVGIATLDTPEAAAKLAKQTKITYPWVLDDTGETAYEADGTTLPTTLLLSADGDVIDHHVGWFHSVKDVQTFVDQAG
jgi:thiol-disulfide isomerase/thioredoxin